MGRLYKDYPPYEGNEPYLFFCFSDSDEQLVRPVLKSLTKRGCRVWYYMGKAKNRKEYDRINKRIEGASLSVLRLTSNACEDTALKNDIKYSHGKGTPIVVIRSPEVESNLPVALPEDLPRAADEEELLRTEGFHAGLIGEPPKKTGRFLKILSALLLALSLAVAAWVGVKLSRGEPLVSRPEDRVELELKKLPESAEELERYPNLQRLIVPQSLAEEALARFPGYEIALTEG